MVQNPDVQRKAQEEIDRVVGNDRLPDISDRPNLPYIEAIMRENIRKFSVIPTGECPLCIRYISYGLLFTIC